MSLPPIYQRPGKYGDHARAQMDQIADLVSEGVTLKAVAKIMGLTECVIHRKWAMIREKMGWQAQ